MLELRDVSKVYPMGAVSVHALRGVTLSVAAGEWLAVMGPSGSGKSTLLHILGCLDVPTSGSYTLDGAVVGGMSEDELAEVRNGRIGFVFQGFNLLRRTSALKQVMLPMQYARDGGRPDRAERNARAMAALEAVGLADRAGHLPTELSGGQQQKVAIARALVNEPRILMADEPTGNLDSRSGREIMALLQTLHADRGVVILVVTHEDEVAAHAARVVRLLDGRVVADERR